LPLRLALPLLEPFLAENVAKEARKDALVIRRAGEALAAGAPPGPEAAREVLSAVRVIDREFLEHVVNSPVRITIRYEHIEPLRLRRIELGLEAAYRVLDAWRCRRRLRDAFAPEEIERGLFDILRLYAEETRALSHSAGLPRILAPLRDRITKRLEEAMGRAALQLSRAAARMGRHGASGQFRQ
jgi:hypothetical protein